MAFVNYNSKEITVKIVYYGPALSGKTTCLKYIYTSKKFEKKGKLITLDTDGDRTLFFDFLPIEIGKLGDYSIKMQLYTVPGQVAYDTTRKLVLQGADGVAFVADSQGVMREQNMESFENLKVNLELNNISYADIPIILLYNKRDIPNVMSIDDLNRTLNPDDRRYFETTATKGINIIESLQEIMRLVIIYLRNRLSIFQKDKTVMFSRDEILARSLGQNVPAPVQEEDADKDVMELSSPIADSSRRSQPVLDTDTETEEEDIFNLDDDGMMGVEDHGLGAEEHSFAAADRGFAREDPVFSAGTQPFVDEEQGFDAEESGLDVDMEDQDVLLQANDLLGDDEEDVIPLQTPAAPTMRKAPAAPPAHVPPPRVPAQAPARVERKIEAEVTGVAVKNLDIPLNIEIPEGKDEIKINLNLHIVVKKKR